MSDAEIKKEFAEIKGMLSLLLKKEATETEKIESVSTHSSSISDLPDFDREVREELFKQ